MRIATLVTLLIAILSGAPAAADSARVGDIAVEKAWVRASSVNVSAAYATLHNLGTEPDLLVAAASPVAARVEIHTIVERDGRVGMKRVDSVEVAPGEPALLQPGGLHIMLMGLKRKLAPGDSIELALRFSKAGRLVIRAPVARSCAPRQPKRTH